MAEENKSQTVNCQIRTTEGNRKRFAELAERAGVSQGSLLGRLLDDAETDEFGAAHKDYSATIEALDEQCRQLKELYKGLIVTAESTISKKTAQADVAVEKMRDTIERVRGERDNAQDEIKRLEAVRGENERLKGELSKTNDELRRRTERVDELEAERTAVKEQAAKAEADRAARAEAEKVKAEAQAKAEKEISEADARATAAEAALEKEREKAATELASARADADARAALYEEKLANAKKDAEGDAAALDELRKQIAALTSELTQTRSEAVEAKSALAAADATVAALREQVEFAKSMALGRRDGDEEQSVQSD